MNKYILTLTALSIGLATTQSAEWYESLWDTSLAGSSSWVNSKLVYNPQVDATGVLNRGVISYATKSGSATVLPYMFVNNLCFTNTGFLNFNAPGMNFEYFKGSEAGYGNGNDTHIPMQRYQNTGIISGKGTVYTADDAVTPGFSVLAQEVIDSGVTQIQGNSVLKITGDGGKRESGRDIVGLDLRGAEYKTWGGNASSLNATGNHPSSMIKAAGVYDYAWAHDTVSSHPVTSMGHGPQSTVTVSEPDGSQETILFNVGDTSYMAYITSTWWNSPTDPKPFYQIVFVPQDEEEADGSYTKYRVTLGSSSYESAFNLQDGNSGVTYSELVQPNSNPNRQVPSITVTQYSYKAADKQTGEPVYEQLWLEDVTGGFWPEMATNAIISSLDGRGFIPDRFRIDRTQYTPDDLPEPADVLICSQKEYLDPTYPDPEDPELQDAMKVYSVEAAAACISGGNPAFLRNARVNEEGKITGFEYRIDPDNPGNAYADMDYSAYGVTVGTNAFAKQTVVDLHTSTLPGSVVINGRNAKLDDMSVKAQESISMNITNVISSKGMLLNANTINAMFRSATNGVVVVPNAFQEESRFEGGVAMYSGIYQVNFQICEEPYVEGGEEPEEPVNAIKAMADGDEEGGEGEDPEDPEEPEEPEWEDTEFKFQVFIVTRGVVKPFPVPSIPACKFYDHKPIADNLVVEAKPAEGIETSEATIGGQIDLREGFVFDAKDLTFSKESAFTFSREVNSQSFVNVENFTNYGEMYVNRLSGSVTNTSSATPSVNLYLGSIDKPYKNIFNFGTFGTVPDPMTPYESFSEISIYADNFTMSDAETGLSAILSHESAGIFADTVSLIGSKNSTEISAGNSVQIAAKKLYMSGASINARKSSLSYGGTGDITLQIADEFSDAPIGGVEGNNTLTAINGGVWVTTKPAKSSLLNTVIDLQVANRMTSRNYWAADDLGDTEAGWEDNLAVGALLLEGVGPTTYFRFYPYNDEKGLRDGGAIYVRDLYLGFVEDSDANINYDKILSLEEGMKLYYVNCYVGFGGTPVPPEDSGIQAAALTGYQWELVDKYPGTNPNVIRADNYPAWERPAPTPITGLAISQIVFNSESAGNDVVLTWNATAGANYVIESATELNGPWKTVRTVKAGSNGEISATVKADGETQFFRICAE